MKRILTGIPALFILAGIAGCNTTGCLDNQSAIPLAGCYASPGGAQISIGSVVQIHGVGAPNDSVLTATSSASYRIYLPMRSAYDRVSWCLHYLQEDLDSAIYNDTITFVYNSIPYFASEECGAMYRYEITECTYTEHVLDSVVIADSLITNTDIERIKIYFRTATREPDPDTPGPDEPNPDNPDEE